MCGAQKPAWDRSWGAARIRGTRPEGTEAIVVRLIGATLPFLLLIGGVNLVGDRPVLGGVLVAMSLSALLRLWLIRRRPQD